MSWLCNRCGRYNLPGNLACYSCKRDKPDEPTTQPEKRRTERVDAQTRNLMVFDFWARASVQVETAADCVDEFIRKLEAYDAR